MRRLSLLCLVLLSAAPLRAQPVMEPGPKSPQDSLKCIQVRPGFTVELMAAEPLVMDPIAFAWGPDGKFWVVEMGDYPLGTDGKNKPGGRVKFLTKSKADGPYDKMTLFLDNLGYPTGVTPWGKGVLVTCAPDIFYAEDTDGDGKADKKEVLFTGFAEGNQQHRVNGLVWGLDNWLYGANGDSGGKVKSLRTGQSVDIRGRDFRLKPDTGAIEPATGQTQFGRARDDWGNWFGNNNTNPMYHFVLDDHYLRRNALLLPPDPRVNVSVKPGASEVFPISKPLPRFNSPQALNHFTSACSAIVYRDTLFGPEFEGNAFVSEPVHNLVHREVMKPKGVTFTSQRAADEQTSEFLASSDNWFRPTTIQTGPDGALWIADMYRYVIEHPEWIPKDWQKKLDLRAGHDKGRIYRVYPKDKTPRAIPQLDPASADRLVELLESPNGWTRDMAQQLLISPRYERDRPFAQRKLKQLLESGLNPKARLHALCTLEGMDQITDHYLLLMLKDSHPAIRRHALRCWETAAAKSFISGDFQEPLAKLLNDPEPQVRLQLAYTLGEIKRVRFSAPLLAKLLSQEAEDRFLLAAGLSSVDEMNGKDVIAAVAAQEQIPLPLLSGLLRIASKYGDPEDMARLVARHLGAAKQTNSGRFLHTAELLDAGEGGNTALRKLLSSEDGAGSSLARQFRETHAAARRVAADAKAPAGERNLALRLLGRGIGDDREDFKLLAALLTPQTPDDLQLVTIQSLGKSSDVRAASVLLAAWKGFSPALRNQALDVLLNRPIFARSLVAKLEKREVPPSEIDAVRRQRLLEHKDSEVRESAARIFVGGSSPDRARLISEYVLTMPAEGDAKSGAKLFAKICATCHKLGEIGQQVGPDLASVGDKSPQGLLVAVLDPNRAVEARYVNYQAVTKDGRTLTGLLANETSTSVTLVGPDGKRHDLLRTEIEELASTGKSVMPDGMEKELPPREMADLIAFVRSSLPAPQPKKFPGNNPTTVRAEPDGTLRLLATNAAIFGPGLVLEKQYSNLGFWSSPDDHAAWTLEVPREGMYAVWLDYACDNSAAGNSFAMRLNGQAVTGQVAGTGSWDSYRRVRIGQVRLAAGRHEATLRAVGPVRGALMDLKEIQLVPVEK